MLREVSEIRNEAREAVEKNVMGYISDAARQGNTDVAIPTKDIPSWLFKRLVEHGYIVTTGKEDTIVYWGYENAQ